MFFDILMTAKKFDSLKALYDRYIWDQKPGKITIRAPRSPIEVVIDLSNQEITLFPFLPCDPEKDDFSDIVITSRTERKRDPNLVLLSRLCIYRPVSAYTVWAMKDIKAMVGITHFCNVYRYLLFSSPARKHPLRVTAKGFELVGFNESSLIPRVSITKTMEWLSYHLLIKRDTTILSQLSQEPPIALATPVIDIAHEAGVMERVLKCPNIYFPPVSLKGHERPGTFVVSKKTVRLLSRASRITSTTFSSAIHNSSCANNCGVLPHPLMHYEGWPAMKAVPFGDISRQILRSLRIGTISSLLEFSQYIERWPPEMYYYQIADLQRNPWHDWPGASPNQYPTSVSARFMDDWKHKYDSGERL